MAHSIATTSRRRVSTAKPALTLPPSAALSTRRPPPSVSSELKPSGQGRVIFFRSLAAMVSAGIPIDRCLQHLASQSDDFNMGRISQSLSDKVRTGQRLSSSMDKFPLAFSRLQVRLVQMGENTGLLDKILAELSNYEEKERATLLRVRSSLVYPAFVLVFAGLLMLIVPPYMLKGIFAMISSSGVQPPLLTRVVMSATDALRSPWFYSLGLFALLITAYAVPKMLRVPRNRLVTYTFMDRVPALGRILKNVAVTRFARALSLQLDCGISPLTGIRVAAEVADNPLVSERVDDSLALLRGGETLQTSLKILDFFPVLFLKMVQVGEESASLPDLLGRTADVYDLELENALDAFTALLEPVVMCAMGLLVGILVVATMLPMAQLLQNL